MEAKIKINRHERKALHIIVVNRIEAMNYKMHLENAVLSEIENKLLKLSLKDKDSCTLSLTQAQLLALWAHLQKGESWIGQTGLYEQNYALQLLQQLNQHIYNY